jgi:hypothetical protein
MHRAWIARQRLDDELARAALEQILIHLDGLDRQLDALDRDLERIARSARWARTVEILTRLRAIATRTALGLIAEIGDFARFSHPRALCAWLGIVPSEYSSGDQRHRGHITKTGNHHARRLLIEAAWSYQHRPRRPDRGPEPDARAWQAQIRLHRRYHHLITARGNAPPSRPSPSHASLPASCGQPRPTNPSPSRPPPELTNPSNCWGPATAATSRRTLDSSMRSRLATLVRGSSLVILWLPRSPPGEGLGC